MFSKNLLFLTLLFLTSCDKDAQPYLITFEPVFNNTKIKCEQPIVINNDDWKLTQLQFYIHNVMAKDLNGKWHKLEIKPKVDISGQVILIGGVCGQDIEWQTQLTTSLQESEIKGIKFTLGVPFELNHKNPITQPAPLNQPDMFWTWQMGYKFARIELASKESEWIFHLGSTGCQSPAPVRPPKENCKNPNRAEIIFDDFSADSKINIDIAKLIEGVDIKTETNCQSSQDNKLCQLLLPRLGIGGNQQVFSSDE